jgi:K+-transporting ATPase ATPase C chain
VKILMKIPKSITLIFWMTVLTGMVYPLAVTGVAEALFPRQANGSLIVIRGEVKGSYLLAQKFESDRFFHPRPSATGYAYIASGASNLAATNSALAKEAQDNRNAWIKAEGRPPAGAEVPPEMLYSSASGLDPDISLKAALGQVDRVAKARGFSAGQKASLIEAVDDAARRATTLIGPPRVNVVELNSRLETDPGFVAAAK